MEKGLTTTQAKENLRLFGKNEIITQKKASVIMLFFGQFPSVINGILALAALFSLFIHDLLDGIFIVAILVLNALFGFIQEYRAEKSLEKLKSFVTSFCRVIRNEAEQQIPTTHIVPKDLVIVSEGERIQADGIVVLSRHMEIDESILTGESLPVIKSYGDPLYSGTLVIKGKGYLRVEKTGINTRLGQLTQTLATIEIEKTPLQKRLDDLGKILSLVALLVSFSLIPIAYLQAKALFPSILLAISIGIAAIPEGLPAVVTIALGIGTYRMAKAHAIVKKMPAIETLGSIQIILVDKTGTLTQNAMRVKKYYLQKNHDLHDLLRACVLGNTASLIEKAGLNDFDIVGDKTDGALLLFAQSQSKNISSIKKEGVLIDEYVFDPLLKTITTIFEIKNKRYAFVRGSPETIISKTHLSLKNKEKITRLYQEYAQEGLRIIGFAKRVLQKETKRTEIEKNLDFIGFLGIYDPPRQEAKQAIIDGKKAGVKPIMVTGDNELTAVTIAKEIGLIEKDENVITGKELAKLDDEAVKKIILKTSIFARTGPEDKLRLVTILKNMGYVVGVTGDGVNDALALKKADVGIAMGETGTDVAKEAGDIVLTDDNFSTLVKAIEEGRTIYNNILKSIMYLLSGNLAELSLVFVSSLAGLPPPLLPTQILWINLVTDGIPALALASDNKDPSLIQQQPRNPKTPVLTKQRILFIITVGFGLAAILFTTFSILLKTTNETAARTITFNLLIFLHLMIAFLVRGGTFFSFNRLLVLGVIFTFVIQILITTIPFFQTIFHLGF